VGTSAAAFGSFVTRMLFLGPAKIQASIGIVRVWTGRAGSNRCFCGWRVDCGHNVGLVPLRPRLRGADLSGASIRILHSCLPIPFLGSLWWHAATGNCSGTAVRVLVDSSLDDKRRFG